MTSRAASTSPNPMTCSRPSAAATSRPRRPCTPCSRYTRPCPTSSPRCPHRRPRRDCSNVLRYRNESPQRLIEVEWGGEQETYPVDVRIIAVDRHGLLRDITSVLANDKINVIAVQTRSDKQQHLAYMTLTMEIASVADLSRVLDKIGQLPNIIEVKRETH